MCLKSMKLCTAFLHNPPKIFFSGGAILDLIFADIDLQCKKKEIFFILVKKEKRSYVEHKIKTLGRAKKFNYSMDRYYLLLFQSCNFL